MKVRGIEPDNLGVVRRRFRQQVFVGSDQIGKLHSCLVGIAARAQDVPLNIDGVFVVGSDGEDVHLVAVANGEGVQLFFDPIGIAARGKVERKHGSFFVGFHALHFDMPERSGGQDSTSELEYIRQRLLAL